MAAPLTVLLVDADPLQREGWRLVLDSLPDVAVVAETASAAEAVALLRRTPIDVVVADVLAPDGGGPHLARRVAEDAQIRLVQAGAPTRVVLTAAADLDRWDGALPKGAPPEELVARVRAS